MKTRTLLLLAFCSSMICSCSLFDPEEQVPGFIVVESFEFTSDFPDDTNSEKITEVWAFSDGQTLGVFGLPAQIPVLKSGPTNISLRAGIKNNGIASTRVLYPFYEPYNFTIDIQPNSLDTIIPQFTYKENVDMVISDNFQNGTLFSLTEASNAGIELIEDEGSFEGSSGKVFLDTDEYLFQAETSEVPLNAGKQIWAELNYKCNNTFAVGLVAKAGDDEQKEFALIITPTTNNSGVDEWNKIYVELTFVANQYIFADSFKLYLEAYKDDDAGTAELWFDNVKIVQFES